jgi:hypothetical protein
LGGEVRSSEACCAARHTSAAVPPHSLHLPIPSRPCYNALGIHGSPGLPSAVRVSPEAEQKGDAMRLGFVGCAMLALALVAPRCDGATKLVPPNDELLATASYVFDAVAEKRLAERDWLFKGAPIATSASTTGRSPYFVGWWNIRPEEAERWAATFPLRPAPQNSKALAQGRRFLVIADADFHLLLVYPLNPKSDQYLPGVSEREFRDRVVYLRSLYATVRNFLAAVTEADWSGVESALCQPLRQKMRASRDPQAYLAKLGVPRLTATQILDILSTEEKQARVVAGGNDVSGAGAEVALTLTRTRLSMGVPGWEIVHISKVRERP